MARRRCGTCQRHFFLFVFSLCQPLHIFLQLQRAVQRHNQLFLRNITQDTSVTGSTTASETVEISVPSSTSVSGFTTPLEMPVTPGEAMDVSN